MKKIICFLSIITFLATCCFVHAQELTAQERAALAKEGWKAGVNGKMTPPANFDIGQPNSLAQRKALGWKFATGKKNGPLIPPPLRDVDVQKELAKGQRSNGVTPGRSLQYAQLPPENNTSQKQSLQYAKLPPEKPPPVMYEKLPSDGQKINYGSLSEVSNSKRPLTQYPKGITPQEKTRIIREVSAGHKAKLGEMVKDVPQQNLQQTTGYQAQRGFQNANQRNTQNQNQRQFVRAQNGNGQVGASSQSRNQVLRYAPISAPPENPDGTNKSNIRAQNNQVRNVAQNPSQRALENRGQGINRQKVSGSNHQKIPAPTTSKATKTNQNNTKKKSKISRVKSKVKKVFSRKKKS